jgi:C-terminal processing protease CtpA/Prc
MRNILPVIVPMMFGLFLSGPLYGADQSGDVSAAGVEGAKGTDGVVGISLHLGAARVGDPASVYVDQVHRGGPGHTAGLRHGDELVSVDGTPISGKSFEQVVTMIRGEPETTVKLGVKRDKAGLREVPVIRVAGDTLMKGPPGHGLYEDPPHAQP